MAVLFSRNFEDGTVDAWSSETDADGDLNVTEAAALGNSRWGAQVTLDDTNVAYLREDFSTLTGAGYRFRFYFDPNNMSMAESDEFTLVNVTTTGGSSLVRMEFGFFSGQYRMRCRLREDADTYQEFTVALADQPYYFEVDVVRATSAVASDAVLTFYGNGVQGGQVSGVDHFDIGQPGRLEIGARESIDAGSTGNFFFDEVIFRDDNQVIGSYVDATWMEAELAGAGNGWTDITDDVMPSIHLEYGISGGGPLDRVADVGVMEWQMRNAALTIAGTSGRVLGYYSPGHATARSGWDLGINVRLWVCGVNKFNGSIVEIEVAPGESRERVVRCKAHDWIDDALICLYKVNDFQTSQRSDQLIDLVVQNCPRRQPISTSYATGQSTFAYAFDNLRDDATPALAALADITFSEVGFLYMRGDGTLHFESRHTRALSDVMVTWQNQMLDMSTTRTRDDIFNYIIVKVHPREVNASPTVVYELTPTATVPSIAVGETISITGYFRTPSGRYTRVGADNVIAPVAHPGGPPDDWEANSQADGLGSDLTASVSLVFTSTSNSATFQFTNNHATLTAYIVQLQCRADEVSDRYDTSIINTDTASQDSFGEQDLVYDMTFEDNLNIADDIAEWLQALYGTVRTKLSAVGFIVELGGAQRSGKALPADVLNREPGHQIRVEEDVTAVMNDYFVNGVEFELTMPNLLAANFILAPADNVILDPWVIEEAGSSLGTNTFLGYG